MGYFSINLSSLSSPLPAQGPDAAKMLADRVKKLSHELFDELVTQVPEPKENLNKVSIFVSSLNLTGMCVCLFSRFSLL